MQPRKRVAKHQAAGDYENHFSSHQQLQDDNDKSQSTSPENSETGNGNGNRSGNGPERFSSVGTTEIQQSSPTE